MGGLFLTSAYLQLNDPDSLLWIVVYLLAAFASFGHEYIARPMFIVGVVVCLLMAGYLLLAIEGVEWQAVFRSFNMPGRGVEEIREVSGLLIIAIWFTILTYVTKRD